MVRGIAYRAQFRYEEAVASLNTAIAYNPNLAPAFAQLGAVQAVTGEARAALHKALLDFFVMTRCAEITQLRIGPMYNSAFSRYASTVGGISFSTVG